MPIFQRFEVASLQGTERNMLDITAGDQRRRGGRTVAGRERQPRRLQPTLLALEDRRLLATLTVTSAADSAPASAPDVNTLRWAVEQANAATSASSIEIELGSSPATITLLQGQLELDNTADATTIYDGPGDGAVTISGNDAGRVFQVDGGVTASISAVTITGGSAFAGGGLFNFGAATLANCTISGNYASYTGGGLSNYGSLGMTNCSVSGNFAYEGAGATNYGSLALNDCTVSDNSASSPVFGGGGVRNGIYGTAILKNCVVSGNSSSYGGALYNEFATATLSNCTVSGNSASGGGGAVFNWILATATLTDCNVSGNVALGFGPAAGTVGGGAVANWYSTATLTNCTLSGNSATGAGGGGAVKNTEYGTAALTNCTVSGNFATGAAEAC